MKNGSKFSGLDPPVPYEIILSFFSMIGLPGCSPSSSGGFNLLSVYYLLLEDQCVSPSLIDLYQRAQPFA